MKSRMYFLYAGISLCMCVAVSPAEQKITLSRFIGPEDYPGAGGIEICHAVFCG